MTTEPTVEEPKPADPRHIRQDFYHLTLDWIHLHTQLPTPTASQGRRAKNREYGHPAQWASDTAAKIAGILHDWHDLMAEHRNETPPPPQTASEQTRITKAWKYLEPRIEQLCTLVTRDDLKELRTLHHQIRNALGYNQPHEILPMPCPNSHCGLKTMARTINVGTDTIRCATCGYTVHDDPDGRNYQWLIRVCLDTLIDT